MKPKIKQCLVSIIVIAFVFSSLNPSAFSKENYSSTDISGLKYKQEIVIPIDTSLEIAKFQPIDIKVKFDNPCWAKNEKESSVRVGYDDGSGINEIESQIYDLEFSDDTHISSCGLVFLIPENANGKEKYHVLYDSSETKPANYKDHIVIEDTHYFYEPIPGQSIDFDYYKITEDNYVVYALMQKGQLLGNPTAHSVAKLKPKSTIVETYNVDQLGVFDMRYGVPGAVDYTGSACATEVTKNVLVDGNLMARMRIVAVSPRGDIKTDNIYTYYYCPTDKKSISVNVYHEVLKTVNIDDPAVLDGTYAGIVSPESRSATIEKMNVGEIMPSLTVYSEDDQIKDFSVPTNPVSADKEVVLSTEDDVDLGNKAWVSLNDPSTGKAHGLIMNPITGLIDGEEDGVQVKDYVRQIIKLPGLEAYTGSVFLTKNSYEKGGSHDTVLPQGFKVNFDVEFLTAEKEGNEKIDAESKIFNELVKTRPALRENVTGGKKEEKERYSLTTYVHFASSVPMGSLLSAALGKNLSYTYAELYEDGNFKSSGSVNRLPLGKIELDLKGKNLFQKLKTMLGIFDWRNASLFKKIKFPDLEPGTYVVKIYRENPRFAKERQYIGFGIIDLKKNDSIRIFCRPEGTITLSILNQENKGVENVKFLLERDNATISDAPSDKEGSAVLKAPCYRNKPYTLKIIYQGFLVKEKQVTFGLKNRFIKLKQSFSIETHTLKLSLKDTWGFTPAVEVAPVITSAEMIEKIHITATKTGDGEYEFVGVYPAKYTLSMTYKSFVLEKEVTVDGDESFDMVFPAEYNLDFGVMNSYGDTISEGKISISRNGKMEEKEIDKNGKVTLVVPPGDYELEVHSSDDTIAKQKIQVRGDKKMDIVTSLDSLFNNLVTYIGIALLIFSILIMLWKKKIYTGMKVLVIALLIIAIVQPWWVLNGDKGAISTESKTLLVPPKIVTLTRASDAIGGEISQVPEQVTMVLNLLSMILVVTCLIIFVTIFTRNRLRKTTAGLSILSIILLIATFSIFFYAMSQITKISVGGFIGSGNIETTIPGVAESEFLPCSWGPGVGFYLAIIAVACLIIPYIINKIKTRINKTNPATDFELENTRVKKSKVSRKRPKARESRR